MRYEVYKKYNMKESAIQDSFIGEVAAPRKNAFIRLICPKAVTAMQAADAAAMLRAVLSSPGIAHEGARGRTQRQRVRR